MPKRKVFKKVKLTIRDKLRLKRIQEDVITNPVFDAHAYAVQISKEADERGENVTF